MKCLFLINGLGLGNSTRCHAVIEHLSALGCEVHVLSSGNGLAYFEGRRGIASLSPMAPFFYSGKSTGVSGWSTLSSVGALAKRAKAKTRELEALLARLSPDVAVIDSEYTVSPLRRGGIPVIGLNTAETVVTQYLKHWNQAQGTRSQFLFIELLDYLFHRHYCDLVLSPFPLPSPTRHHKFRRIGLIVRRAISALDARTSNPVSPRQVKKAVFMLSGSVHASRVPFERFQLPFQVEVLGRSGDSRENLTFRGRSMDSPAFLADADVLVINGGYSALSEAFALRKPTFVIPVPGHAEQFVNACLARDLGLGFVATENDVLEQLLEMHRQDRWIGLKPMPEAFEMNGARQAAEAIASFKQPKPAAQVPKAATVNRAGV